MPIVSFGYRESIFKGEEKGSTLYLRLHLSWIKNPKKVNIPMVP